MAYKRSWTWLHSRLKYGWVVTNCFCIYTSSFINHLRKLFKPSMTNNKSVNFWSFHHINSSNKLSAFFRITITLNKTLHWFWSSIQTLDICSMFSIATSLLWVIFNAFKGDIPSILPHFLCILNCSHWCGQQAKCSCNINSTFTNITAPQNI